MTTVKIRRFIYFLLLVLCALYAIPLAFALVFMESPWGWVMIAVMIPLLVGLMVSISLRYQRLLKKNDGRMEIHEDITPKSERKHVIKEGDTIILLLNDNRYFFSVKSIVLLLVGAPILIIFLFLFLALDLNGWLQEIVTKQTGFLLNLFFNVNAGVIYSPGSQFTWSITIPSFPEPFYMSIGCTAIHVISMIFGIVICTPHSRDRRTKGDIIWRKTKIIGISLLFLYVGNIFRLLVLILLALIGLPFDLIHQFTFYLSAAIMAVVFIIFLFIWLPEFFLSLYYIYPLINQKMEKK